MDVCGFVQCMYRVHYEKTVIYSSPFSPLPRRARTGRSRARRRARGQSETPRLSSAPRLRAEGVVEPRARGSFRSLCYVLSHPIPFHSIHTFVVVLHSLDLLMKRRFNTAGTVYACFFCCANHVKHAFFFFFCVGGGEFEECKRKT